MQREFWQERWDSGQIGFHRSAPHPDLVRHHGDLGQRVFVPLAGKALDLHFLRDHGHEVVGCEIIERAVRSFYDEARVRPEVAESHPFRIYTGAGITMYCGDIFALRPAHTGLFDGIYDRAALVAIAPGQRALYVERTLSLLKPGGRVLLVTLQYDQTKVAGPPFSVDDHTVQALYGTHCAITPLGERDEPMGPKYLEAGVGELREAAHGLQKYGQTHHEQP
jgi:thiopurine S-methyltransferase